MLRKREIVFKASENNRLSIRNGSLFHGFLMESIPTEFAESMHASALRPFSQHLHFARKENCWIWTIGSLDQEIDGIFEQVFNELRTVELKNKGCVLDVDYVRTYPAITYKKLTEQCYTGETHKIVDIEFLTPASFKVSGQNIILPDIRLIYQNIVNRWNSFSETITIEDKNAMDHIIQHTQIMDYNLRTKGFPLEAVVVKGFEGKLTLRLNGPETLISLCNLLFRFAEFSGIGTRTALGMGGVRIEFR